MKPKYWKKAQSELSAQDPVLKKIISAYRGETLVSRGDPYETLLRAIVGQQISVKAAASIWLRVEKQISTKDPKSILKTSLKKMRACGISERKYEYMCSLAEHFKNKKLSPQAWSGMQDEELIEALVDVRGIGRWTAEMFLIFYLLRPNIFPKDDLGLQKAISLNYKKRYPMSLRTMRSFQKKWDPWCSVATWYMWRSLDPIPVEY